MIKRFLLFLSVPLLFSSFASAQANSTVSDRAAGRFLEQATWGPSPASIADLEHAGFQG